MKIKLTVRQVDLTNTLQELQGQMGCYYKDYNEHGLTIMGDKMNIYVDRCPHALLPTTLRILHILPKPEIL